MFKSVVDIIYDYKCSTCVGAWKCHNNCTNCDEFEDLVFLLEDKELYLITEEALCFLDEERPAEYAFSDERYNGIAVDAYVDYVLKWFKEHDEGEPACFEEWFNNEYQEF